MARNKCNRHMQNERTQKDTRGKSSSFALFFRKKVESSFPKHFLPSTTYLSQHQILDAFAGTSSMLIFCKPSDIQECHLSAHLTLCIFITLTKKKNKIAYFGSKREQWWFLWVVFFHHEIVPEIQGVSVQQHNWCLNSEWSKETNVILWHQQPRWFVKIKEKIENRRILPFGKVFSELHQVFSWKFLFKFFFLFAFLHRTPKISDNSQSRPFLSTVHDLLFSKR